MISNYIAFGANRPKDLDRTAKIC